MNPEQEREESVRSKTKLVTKSNPSGPFSSLESCVDSSVSYQHAGNWIRIGVIGMSTIATVREIQSILEREHENSPFSKMEFDLRYSDPVMNKIQRLVELAWFWYKELKNKDKVVRIRMSPTLLKGWTIKDKEIRESLGDSGYRTNGFRIEPDASDRSKILQCVRALALPGGIPNVPDLLDKLANKESVTVQQEEQIQNLKRERKLLKGHVADSTDEEDEIVQALNKWAEGHDTPDKPLLVLGRRSYSPKQLVQEVRSGTRFGKELKAKIIRQAARSVWTKRGKKK